MKRRIPFAALAVAVLVLLAYLLPVSGEWRDIFMRAGNAVLAGRNPYATPGFFSPPHALLIAAPLSRAPIPLSSAIQFAGELLAGAFLARRLGARSVALAAFLASPFVLISAWGNLDLLCLLGMVLPPHFGAPLLLLKPQLGLGVILYWLVTERKGPGYKWFLLSLVAVGLVWLLGIAAWGDWPLISFVATGKAWNASVFPFSLPLGFALFAWAVRSVRMPVLPGATLAVSPYVWLPSWPIALFLPLLSRPKWCIALALGTWLFAAWRVAVA